MRKLLLGAAAALALFSGVSAQTVTNGGAIPGGSSGQDQYNNGGVFGGSPLFVENANSVRQRNGTTAQSFCVAHSFTDAVDYDQGCVKFSGSNLLIGSELMGTGSSLPVQVEVGGTVIGTFSSTGLALTANLSKSSATSFSVLAASAQVLQLGNADGVGLTVSGASSTINGSIVASGSTPTLTGTCTTGTKLGGEITFSFHATCTAQTVIATFVQVGANGWNCIAQDVTTPADTLKMTANGTNSCTLTGTTVASDVITVTAIAY